MDFKNISHMLSLQQDLKDLVELGLDEEELLGYLDIFADEIFSKIEVKSENN